MIKSFSEKMRFLGYIPKSGSEEGLAEAIQLVYSPTTPSGNHVMQPEELTDAAVYLASEDSSSVHGLDLIVDGGVAAVQ
jgi:NAD(P)-dependent dehydrogenase (short-subunit alcohol dehydrogenase family)